MFLKRGIIVGLVFLLIIGVGSVFEFLEIYGDLIFMGVDGGVLV